MIENLEKAVEVAKKKIVERLQADKIKNVYEKNKGRHKLIVTKNGMQYWVLYKRDFFRSFGKIFSSFKGLGESINKRVLIEAIDKGVDNILFVYKKTDKNDNPKIYAISPYEFYQFASNQGTIRRTESGEITYSIPVKMLKRWK